MDRIHLLAARAMTLAVDEYDDDHATADLATLAAGDTDALDRACDVCFGKVETDLATRRRAIELLARVRYGKLP
jgi:hypothetical protein